MTIYEDTALWRQTREQLFLDGAPQSLGELLSEAAQKYGDTLAIDLFDRGQKLSFKEWNVKASKLASGFQSIGIRQGMHVGIVLRNVVEFPVTWMALARMGAVLVPINPNYTPTELQYVIDDAMVKHLVFGQESIEKVGKIKRHSSEFALDNMIVVGNHVPAKGCHSWEKLLDDGSRDFVPDEPITRSDLAAIQYTSGTTGFPKGCMQSHGYWLLCGFNQQIPRDVFMTGSILGESPFFYLDALMMMSRTLSHGVTLFQAERMSIQQQDYRLINTQVEVAFAPVLGDQPSPQEQQHNVKVFICVNGPVNVVKEIERRYGVPVREAYGMTEVGIAFAVPYKVDDDTAFGTCGVPYPHYEAKIVSSDGHDLPAETPGELWVRGIGVMDGYWNNAEANANSFVDGWFRTGDIFVKTSKDFFRYVGRIKDMIKRSGENISAVEVETVIRQFAGINDVAVIPVPHKIRGEEVKAVMTLRDGVDEKLFDFDALRIHCETHLAHFKIPRYIEFVSSFEYTPSEKITKTGLVKNNSLIGDWDYTIGGKIEP